MLKKFLITVWVMMFVLYSQSDVYGQSKKNKNHRNDFQQSTPSSRNPGNYNSDRQFSQRKLSKSKGKNNMMKQLDAKVAEYHKRMKANKKKYKKRAKLSKKPQFSDPSYFGHKRKPKKRPPGKKKFCKACEIVH